MVLSGLEVPTRALGFVAGFTGRALEQMLQAQGIQTDFVPLAAGNTRINVKIFADRQTDINAPGAQPAEAEVEALFHKLEGLVPGDFLVLAGAVPSQMPGSIYEQICAKLQNKGVHIVVDTTGDALLAVLDYHPFLIKPNHHELGEIFGEDIRPDDEEKIRFFAAKLQEKGARNAGRGRQHPLRGRGARQTGEQCRLRRLNGGRVPGRVRRQRRLQDGAPVGFRRR